MTVKLGLLSTATMLLDSHIEPGFSVVEQQYSDRSSYTITCPHNISSVCAPNGLYTAYELPSMFLKAVNENCWKCRAISKRDIKRPHFLDPAYDEAL